MTYSEKYQQIMEWYKGFENKTGFCFGLSAYLEAEGKGDSSSDSIYKNWFRPYVGNIPKSKIDLTYDYTKNYKKNMDGMGGEDKAQHGTLLATGDHGKGTGQD